MVQHLKRASVAATLIAISMSAVAQVAVSNTNKLVNVDTPNIPGPNAVSARADARLFGGDEKQGYGTVEVNAGLQKGFALTVRGSFSKFSRFNAGAYNIRHGGSDVEAMLRYSGAEFPHMTISGGVSLPNTPAQDQLFATGNIVYEYPGQNINLFFGAKGVFRTDSTLAGAFAGFDIKAGQGVDLVGDITGVFTGKNTHSIATGGRYRKPVFGVALRYNSPSNSRQQYSFEIGVTNGIGGTTGFSLTPGLGSSVALMLGASVRY